jgi:uncharacterized protein (TIGR02231 family)
LIALTVALAAPGPSEAAVPASNAKIVEVTVYRDRAEVVREATVDLPAGASTVEFAGIPFGIDSDSVRVTAEGVPATLGAIEIQEFAEEPRETAEWKAARDEVRRLEREIAGLDDENAVDTKLRDFLGSLAVATADKSSREMAEGRADPESIGTVYSMMESKLRSLGRAGLDRRERRRDLDDKLKVARARLQTLRPRSDIRWRTASVEVESGRAGNLTLRLSYLTPGASWVPTYRATLDADSKEVVLISEGVVRQSTGEDWTGVELHLSSAAPAMGVQPPMLTSWVLRPLQMAGVAGAYSDEFIQELPVPGRFYQNVTTLAPGVQDADGDGTVAEPAAVAASEVVRSAYNVSFSVPGRSDIPADGRDHRVILRQENLDANVVHRTVPGIDPRAFLTAVTTSPQDYPLLAGRVRVFAGGAYLGSYRLEETGPGVELTIPFGVDNRVEVIRVPEPDMKSSEGWSGKQRQVHKHERTILHSLMDHGITLILEDRLPVSEDERIEVEMGKETTPGYKESERRPGVKIWTLDLAAGEKREIVLDYSVRYPRELNLPGLE